MGASVIINKILLFLIVVGLLALPVSATKLFEENFSDGQITSNPTWTNINGVLTVISQKLHFGNAAAADNYGTFNLNTTNAIYLTRDPAKTYYLDYTLSNITYVSGRYTVQLVSYYGYFITLQIGIIAGDQANSYLTLTTPDYADTQLLNYAITSANHDFSIIYNESGVGNISVYQDGIRVLTHHYVYPSYDTFGYTLWQSTDNLGGSNQVVLDDITFCDSNPCTPALWFDPSGYVKDSLGNGIFNAKVQLSNSTWTDPCLSSCFSDANGYWNTNIYANGTYNYNVTKNGYTTLTGSQAFTIGGVNNNFTLTASSGMMSGHVYTTSPSTGSVAIKGDIDSLKADYTKKTIFVGGTITLGSGWVVKVTDIDSAGGRALITIFHDGNEIYIDELVQKGQRYQYKINEDATQTTYIDINIINVFGGVETSAVQIDAGFESVRKLGGTITSFISSLLAALTGQSVMWNIVFYNLANLVTFTTDGSNPDYVTYNSSSGIDATGSYTFDTTSSGDIYNFYAIVNAESSTSNAGKIEIGYTDDNILVAPGMTDTLYINNKQLYRGTTTDFKSLDADNNKKIKIWFTFKGGYSNFKLYEFYMNALGATTIKPLEGANIYFSATSNTLSGSLGEYQLPIGLGTNTIYFYKNGYESKNVTHIFNASYPSFSYDVVLNATNKTTNLTEEYISVNPNPVTIGTQAYALYKTLDKTNFLLGGYQIAVCPLLSVSDCDKYDVSANTEGSIPLNSYGIGEYTISLTGYKSWEVFRTIIVSNNFTVISSTPSIKWGTSPYYLGETMILSSYIPSGNSIVTIKYPNGSVLFSNNYSASSLIYNTSFQTNSNISINQYPPGAYIATIEGGNTATTQLLNQSVSEYSIDVPLSLLRGLILNINYKSPRTTTLYMTDSDGVVWISKDVSGTKTEIFNTSKLSAKATVLNIKLLQGTNKVAEANVSINFDPTTSSGTAIETSSDIVSLFTQKVFWALIFIVGIALMVAKRERKG